MHYLLAFKRLAEVNFLREMVFEWTTHVKLAFIDRYFPSPIFTTIAYVFC